MRFRKADFTTYLTGTPWGEDFMRQYAAALDGVKAQATRAKSVHRAPRPGTINALCRPLLPIAGLPGAEAVNAGDAPEHHRELPQRAWRQAGEEAGPRAFKDIIGAKADTPHAANDLLKVLRVLLGYAVAST